MPIRRREHNVAAEHYIAMYDATVAAMTIGMAAMTLPGEDRGPWKGGFGGPSLAGFSLAGLSGHGDLGLLLNRSSHTPTTTPLDTISFH